MNTKFARTERFSQLNLHPLMVTSMINVFIVKSPRATCAASRMLGSYFKLSFNLRTLVMYKVGLYWYRFFQTI